MSARETRGSERKPERSIPLSIEGRRDSPGKFNFNVFDYRPMSHGTAFGCRWLDQSFAFRCFFLGLHCLKHQKK